MSKNILLYPISSLSMIIKWEAVLSGVPLGRASRLILSSLRQFALLLPRTTVQNYLKR